MVAMIKSNEKQRGVNPASTANLTEDSKLRNTLIFGVSLIFLMVLFRTAWISDDANITFRVVVNFINGSGPVYNLLERVQAYTHPLWFLFLSAGALIFTPSSTAFLLSIIFSVGAVVILARFAASNLNIVIIGLAIVFSKAFVDYSTSGLESPLSHFLIATMALCVCSSKDNFSNAKLLNISFLLGCVYLTRPDLVLLFFPLFIYLTVTELKHRKRLFYVYAPALFLCASWIIFALVYYGMPFSNTAYAKLATQIPSGKLFQQGLLYFLDSFLLDPLTLSAVLVSLVIAFTSKSKPVLMLALGICIYLFYVAKVGGCFMSGRFFTPPFILGLTIIARKNITISECTIYCIAALLLGMPTLQYTLLAQKDYYLDRWSSAGIADERGYYFRKSSLYNFSRDFFNSMVQTENMHLRFLDKPTSVQSAGGGIGFAAMGSAPSDHWIDICGLCDPLLSKLPIDNNKRWRIGHFVRTIPKGYFESIRQNKNLIEDPEIHKFYDCIRSLTRDQLFTKERLMNIYNFNLKRIPWPDKATYQKDVVEKG